MITDEMLVAGNAALDAAVDIEWLRRKPEDLSILPGVAKLTELMDQSGRTIEDQWFIMEVLERCGYKNANRGQALDAWREILKNLRQIEVFGVGNFTSARAFCFAFNHAYLAASQEASRPHYLVA